MKLVTWLWPTLAVLAGVAGAVERGDAAARSWIVGGEFWTSPCTNLIVTLMQTRMPLNV